VAAHYQFVTGHLSLNARPMEPFSVRIRSSLIIFGQATMVLLTLVIITASLAQAMPVQRAPALPGYDPAAGTLGSTQLVPLGSGIEEPETQALIAALAEIQLPSPTPATSVQPEPLNHMVTGVLGSSMALAGMAVWYRQRRREQPFEEDPDGEADALLRR
jgi:hypothetical protein